MTASTAPLAALLTSHPEECAAVVAVLCADFDPRQGLSAEEAVQDVAFFEPDAGATPDRVRVVLDVLCAAGLAERDASGDYAIGCHGRYTIARMGAAAWLAARLSFRPTPLERMSAAFDHLAAINVVADGLPELERDAVEQARLRLFVALDGTAHAKRGIPEYGEDEVRERTGAGAPAKGEQR